MPRPKYFHPNEISLHKTEDDLWVTLFGKVLDLTPLAQAYKGDALLFPLLAFAGKDVSHFFDEYTKEVKAHINPCNGNIEAFLPFRSFVDAPSQSEIEARVLAKKAEDIRRARLLAKRVDGQMKMMPIQESEESEGESKSMLENIDEESVTEEKHDDEEKSFESGKGKDVEEESKDEGAEEESKDEGAKEEKRANEGEVEAQATEKRLEEGSSVAEAEKSIPWWKDENYVIGLLTKKSRWIRIVNTMILEEVIVEVCREETIADILQRYMRFNCHARSYTWKYLGSELDMEQTLQMNGIPDKSDLLYRLKITEEDYMPALHIYFNDDLTEM